MLPISKLKALLGIILVPIALLYRSLSSLHCRIRNCQKRILDRFTVWFSSEGGVYQTFIITAVIVILEYIFPHVDKHGFWLLFWLTVYSGWTQSALAHAGQISGERLEHVIEQLDYHELQLKEQTELIVHERLKTIEDKLDELLSSDKDSAQ